MNLVHFIISKAEVNVLGLQVGVNDITHPMEEVKASETLLSHLPNNGKWRSLIVIPFDYFK